MLSVDVSGSLANEFKSKRKEMDQDAWCNDWCNFWLRWMPELRDFRIKPQILLRIREFH